MNEHDDKKRYCRMLGHHVPFSYCRSPGSDTFCRHIINCWFEQFDVQAYLRDHFSQEEIDRAMRPPSPKMASLLSLIDSAKKSTSSENEK